MTISEPDDRATSMSKIKENNHQVTLNNHLALLVQNVSKMYPLYANPQARLRQSLWYALPKLLRSNRAPEFYKEFWALRDISFEIKKGETVGIIGRNGSGKSTLLQIIAGTLAPTAGQVQVNGRVTALLELGSGFNPEFTGRENVYLNGSILGLSQAEVDDLYDDIVAFADIGQFIDQPVKLYSSGMVVRLSFAVQAFVSKQVLIVDEALSVGDVAFQRKCMRILENFKDAGGTVLLVSHDAQTIVRQCQRCLLLSHGDLLADGPAKPVTDLYQKIMFSPSPQQVNKIIADLQQNGLEATLINLVNTTPSINDVGLPADESTSDRTLAINVSPEPDDWFDPNMPPTHEVQYGNGGAEIFAYGFYNQNNKKVNVLVMGQRYYWRYRVRFIQDAYEVNFGMMLKTVDGLDVTGVTSNSNWGELKFIPAGRVVEVTFTLRLNVTPGVYFLNAGVSGQINQEYTYLHRRVDVCMIRVQPLDDRDLYGIAYLEPHFEYGFVPEDNQS